MDKKDIFKIGLICVLLLFCGWYMEQSDKTLKSDNTLERQENGEGDKSVELILNATGLEEDYEYDLNLEEIHIGENEAKEYFDKAKKEIDETICADGENIDKVTKNLHVKESYANGKVSAEWMFSGGEINIDSQGNIDEDSVPKEGGCVEVSVDLTCNGFTEKYVFTINVFQRKLGEQEQLIKDINEKIENQQEAVNESVLKLPDEVDGRKLSWEEPKRHLVIKIFIFEVVIIILLKLMKLEQAKEEFKKRQESLKLDYSDIVSKISILMGAGMSIKQAWDTIANRYLKNKEEEGRRIRPAYEEMLITSYEIADGESERVAYQRFGERTRLSEYHRFARILVQSIQKGSNGVCETLEKEACEAFEQRKAYAKKLGEEASTKMLMPMMIMLAIVMAVIMVPAAFSLNL
ncbi:MAG: type II secretion system F family protein [Agathobacter sp.]|nr:type II secretion system F family protein [Agathobacter sp.]